MRTSACVEGREQLVEYRLLAASAFLLSIPISRCNGTCIDTNTTGNSNYLCSLSTHISHSILDGLVWNGDVWGREGYCSQRCGEESVLTQHSWRPSEVGNQMDEASIGSPFTELEHRTRQLSPDFFGGEHRQLHFGLSKAHLYCPLPMHWREEEGTWHCASGLSAMQFVQGSILEEQCYEQRISLQIRWMGWNDSFGSWRQGLNPTRDTPLVPQYTHYICIIT